jgi:hypothetical protein
MLGIRLLRLVPALLLAMAAACGGRRWGGTPPPAALVFTNESLSQADVYLIPQGLGARRIGTVMTGHTDTLLVPADIAGRGGAVNIVARLFARSIVAQSGPVTIAPGQMYEVRLPSDARLLSFLHINP